MEKKLKLMAMILISFLGSNESRAEVLTLPGQWRSTPESTTYINCQGNIDGQLEGNFCQLSPGGSKYRLFCPALEKIEASVKRLDKSFYCYAKKQECVDPLACSILEKVVNLPGADLCQHGELTSQRQCPAGFLYQFDKKMNKKTNQKIVDQCCRKIEIFARPGVSH